MGVVDLFNQIAANDFGFFQQVRTVADVMTRNPRSVGLDDTYAMVDELFRRGRIHHAPVLNPDDQAIVGVVSDRDLLRHRPRLLGKAAEGDKDSQILRDTVTKFMTRGPVWCTKDCPAVKALSLMLDHHVDSVLVSPDGKVLEGIVSPRDFIRTMLLYHRVCTRDFSLRRLRLVDLDLRNGIPLDEVFSCGAQTVRDVMTKDVECIARNDTIASAIAKMQDHEYRHLPVVNADGQFAGMLSDRELLRWMPTPTQRSQEPETRFRERLFGGDLKGASSEFVQSIMDEKAKTVTPDLLLMDAMAMFQENSISGLVVVEANTDRPCGILTTSDIMRVFRVVLQIGMLNEHSDRKSAAPAECAK